VLFADNIALCGSVMLKPLTDPRLLVLTILPSVQVVLAYMAPALLNGYSASPLGTPACVVAKI
jgi:hypothetical protein